MKKRRITRARKNSRYIILLAIFVLVGGLVAIQRSSADATTHNLVKYPKSKMTRIALKKVDYQPGDIIKDAENLTLYAVWNAVALTPITDNPTENHDDEDENINDASAVNDGEDDGTLIITPEEPSELPATGPTEIAVAVIACVCVASGAAYLFMSNRQLKHIQRTVRGNSRKKRK